MTRRRRRHGWRLPENQMQHIVGVRAWFNGDCVRCPDRIVADVDRVVRHGDGYIHARCASGGDE